MQELVELIQISPRIRLDIRYATPHNFTGRVVYPSARCFLVRQVAQRLHRVQISLEKQGIGLKVFDGYRPLSVQKIFWEICPNSDYVANPEEGSRHNRGSAVDVTLVKSTGEELRMPTDFDDFTEKASHAYEGSSLEAQANRKTLKKAMEQEGFLSLDTEWWHYDDPDWAKYPILDLPIPR